MGKGSSGVPALGNVEMEMGPGVEVARRLGGENPGEIPGKATRDPWMAALACLGPRVVGNPVVRVLTRGEIGAEI